MSATHPRSGTARAHDRLSNPPRTRQNTAPTAGGRRREFQWNGKMKKRGSRIIRLRTILRYAKDPQVEIGLREFIADAEARLDMLERSRLRSLDTDAHRADKRPY